MRISDWSSDVCSSDLRWPPEQQPPPASHPHPASKPRPPPPAATSERGAPLARRHQRHPAGPARTATPGSTPVFPPHKPPPPRPTQQTNETPERPAPQPNWGWMLARYCHNPHPQPKKTAGERTDERPEGQEHVSTCK